MRTTVLSRARVRCITPFGTVNPCRGMSSTDRPSKSIWNRPSTDHETHAIDGIRQSAGETQSPPLVSIPGERKVFVSKCLALRDEEDYNIVEEDVMHR